MVEVPLTHGFVAIIDDEDAERVLAHRWRAKDEGRGAAHKSPQWYARNATTYLHRFIIGAPRGMQVDHVNGDRLDCRRSNLRLATNAQNAANRSNRGGASSFKGVSYPLLKSGRRKWQAMIFAAGRAKWLGYFETEEDAARAYDRAAVEAYGEYARLNLPSMVGAVGKTAA